MIPRKAAGRADRLIGLVLAAGIVGAPSLVRAEAMEAGPPGDKVCITTVDGRKIIDKVALARFWMTTLPVNLAALPPKILENKDLSRLPADVLSQGDFCTGNSNCSAADRKSLQGIRSQTMALLAGRVTGYVSSDSVSPEVFFAGANTDDAVTCTEAAYTNAAAAPSPTPPNEESGPTFIQRFEVRGAADQLAIGRPSTAGAAGDASSASGGGAFQATTPATLSVLRDGVAKTNTYNMTGVFGVIALDTAPNSPDLGWKIVPYVGVNRTGVSAFTGPSKPATNNTFDTGVLVSNDFPVGDSTILVSVRPDYLWNYLNGSRVFTANFEVTPVVNGNLNDYLKYIPTSSQVGLQVLADARVDLGFYTRPGTNAQALMHPDYTRLGGMAGLDLTSFNKSVPLDLKASYIGLYGASGGVDIGYFASSLTYSPDPNKYVGVSLSYTNGRREDTAKREEQTNIALTVKY